MWKEFMVNHIPKTTMGILAISISMEDISAYKKTDVNLIRIIVSFV